MGALQRLTPLGEVFELELSLTTWFLRTYGIRLIFQAEKSGQQLEGEK